MRVRLNGGANDGTLVDVWSWQDIVYVVHPVTMNEFSELQINETMAWKLPEDVYTRRADGSFVFERTVHYKPEHACRPNVELRGADKRPLE
jgi:hypothetical protein